MIALSGFDAIPDAADGASTAIVDLGVRPEAALQALMRLASEKIAQVVLGYEAQDLPIDWPRLCCGAA